MSSDRLQIQGKSQGKSHLRLRVDRVPETVLLPGDRARVLEIASQWDSYEEVGSNREFVTAVGRYKGTDIAACSTGIGGPSTEIAVVELFHYGARNLIRVGTSGGLAPCVNPGDLVVVSGCVRCSGAADSYVPPNFPAVGHYETTLALIEACEALDHNYHVGLGLTVDSFYATKPHLVREEPIPTELEPQLEKWQRAGVLHVEMETATLFVVAALLGMKAGAVCTVGSNLALGKRPPVPPPNGPAIEAACMAAVVLRDWEKLSRAHGGRFHPSLLVRGQKEGNKCKAH